MCVCVCVCVWFIGGWGVVVFPIVCCCCCLFDCLFVVLIVCFCFLFVFCGGVVVVFGGKAGGHSRGKMINCNSMKNIIYQDHAEIFKST